MNCSGSVQRRERLAKYEERILDIEARREMLAGGRKSYTRFFVGLPIVAGLGFIFGDWFGVGTVFTGLLMSVFGFYTIAVRSGEYDRELEDLESVAEDLREQLGATSTTGQGRRR
jgi:hypothetical protein